MIASTSESEAASQGTFREWHAILALSFIFLLINVVTASRSPAIWTDEAMLTDPAASLYFGHGLHSTAWPLMTKEQIYINNGITYEAALFGWMKIFGFSPTAVRSLNYTLMILAALMINSAVRRTRLVPSARGRLVLVCMLFCGFGVSFGFRSGRYDILGLTVLCAAFLATTIRHAALRHISLVLLGALIIWTGVQMMPMLCAWGILLLLFVGRRALPPLLATAAGTIVGAATMFVAFRAVGEWNIFLHTVLAFSPTNATSQSLLHRLVFVAYATARSILDYSVIALVPLLIIALMVTPRDNRRRSPAAFGLCAAFLIPLAMQLANHYPIYYCWMTFLPVAIASAASWDLILRRQQFAVRTMAAISLVAACLVGLPTRLILTALEWNQRDYTPVETLVDTALKPNDWVFCDYAAFYPAKRRAVWAFFPSYLPVISPEEKRHISVLVIDPDTFQAVQQAVGGEWRATGQRTALPKTATMPGLHHGVGTWLYSLAVYRRTNS